MTVASILSFSKLRAMKRYPWPVHYYASIISKKRCIKKIYKVFTPLVRGDIESYFTLLARRHIELLLLYSPTTKEGKVRK